MVCFLVLGILMCTVLLPLISDALWMHFSADATLHDGYRVGASSPPQQKRSKGTLNAGTEISHLLWNPKGAR